MSENPTPTKQAIAEALDYALQEHGLDDMGFSTPYAADIAIEGLKEAGYVIVSLLGPNQCGACQHWSWEHQGPVHPCKLCDCERLKHPDPDRTDENMDEPD